MKETSGGTTKSEEPKVKPTCDSGPMRDIRTMREMADVNLEAVRKYGAALDEIRIFIDGSDVIDGPEYEDLSDILKAVGK